MPTPKPRRPKRLLRSRLLWKLRKPYYTCLRDTLADTHESPVRRALTWSVWEAAQLWHTVAARIAASQPARELYVPIANDLYFGMREPERK
jgi:hypothetical protein